MLTYTCANAILNNLITKSTSYPYTSLYVGLSTTTPSRDGTGYTEPSGNGYERVILGVHNQSYTQKMGTPNLGSVTNSEEIHFKSATGAWGTCTHFLLFNAATGGTLLAYGQLTDEISPIADTVPIIPAGDIVMGLS